jgi:GGDEF domain-containing protein
MKRPNELISLLLFRKKQTGHVKNGPKNVQKASSRSLTSEAEQKLLKILSCGTFVNTGCIQLLGLDQIKNRIGEDWPKRKDKILDTLAQIVSRRTRKEDVFFSKSDEEHIIVFASLSEKKAQFICAKILQELSDKFLGHTDTKDIIVKTATGKLDGELVFSIRFSGRPPRLNFAE